MPDDTPILSLPLILPAQAQKHVTHNEALAMLDVIVQLTVFNMDQTTPPALPAIGDRHIVAPGGLGPWDGKSGKIAVFTETGWQFYSPMAGWQAFVLALAQVAYFDGLAWEIPDAPTMAPLLGINATADSVNRLSVSADAVLFSHAGGGHQVKVNKAAPAQTASLLFQTGFSGRAEMGTMGNENFGIKVSSTGTGFLTALSVAADTGLIAVPEGFSADEVTLCDTTNPTRKAKLSLSSISAGVTRTLTLPNVSSELAALGGTQTFNGSKTFSGTFTVSAPTATFGSSTANAAYGLGAGATLAANAKSINIGTAGVAGSTTSIVLGSDQAGALGSLTVHSPTVTFASSVAGINWGTASVTGELLGLGGATADSTNRLAVAAPGVSFSHAGAGMEATINKATATDTAMLTFKTGFSTRAQLGLLGSDALALKVSANGSSFSDVFSVDAATGGMTVQRPLALTGQASDPASPTDGAIWHNSTTGQIRTRLSGEVRVLSGQQSTPWLTPVVGDFVLTTTGMGGGSTGTLAGAVGRVDIFPFIPRADTVIDRMAVNCTTGVAAALGKIVVYASDANGRPGSLILETGDLDLATTGAKLATVSLTLRQGLTYWFGLRHSSTATVSTWTPTATPDLNGGASISTTGRKVLRRTLTYGTAAPTNWGFLSSEINAAAAPAIWLRIG